MRITHELVISAPADRVWSLTEDLESWHEVTPTMTVVRRQDAGPLRVGSTARVEQPGLWPATWTVTALEPPRQLVWQTELLGARLVAGHHVTPLADGCRNLLVVDVVGRRGSLLGRVAGPSLRRAVATENDGFRRAAEGLDRPRFVDEHRQVLPTTPGRAWQAVRDFADHLLDRSESSALTRLLGTDPPAGFEVAAEVPPRLLSLSGRHRFSDYVLDLRVAAVADGAEVSAVTYADFPGPHGRAYRAAVIGTRGHVLAVRRMLAAIAERA